jgi:hypothetical protein
LSYADRRSRKMPHPVKTHILEDKFVEFWQKLKKDEILNFEDLSTLIKEFRLLIESLND